MGQVETGTALSRGKRSIISPSLFVLVGMIGPILFVLVFTIDGFLRPGYSPIREVVSNLGVGADAWIQNVNCIASGLLLISFAIGFYGGMRSVISRRRLIISTLLLVLAGACLVNEGFFTTDIPGYPAVTFHGLVHDIGFLVLFTSLMITFFLVGWCLRKTPAWRGYGWYSMITTFVTLGLLVINFYVSIHAPQVAGLAVRVFTVEGLAWYVVIGWRFLVLERANHGG
jgi:hypothetical membrane protein